MIRIHREKGRHERVAEFARTMAGIAAETGDSYLWPKSRRHLVDAGYRLDGDYVQAGPHGAEAEQAPTAKPRPKPAPALPKAAALTPQPAPESSAPAIPPPVTRKKPAGNIHQMLPGML